MADIHQGLLNGEFGSPIIVQDPFPLRSAQPFKYVSDEIWKMRPSRYSEYNAVLGLMNSVITKTDEELVFAGGHRDLTISGLRGDEMLIPREQLLVPKSVSVETYRHDPQFDTRQLSRNDYGTYNWVKFTDGHRDYARTLGINFHYRINDFPLTLGYSSQRYQYTQGQTARIYSKAVYGQFLETDYERNMLATAEQSEAYEIAFLEVLAEIGSISLDGFSRQ